jgi:hypothetical protein
LLDASALETLPDFSLLLGYLLSILAILEEMVDTANQELEASF